MCKKNKAKKTCVNKNVYKKIKKKRVNKNVF